MTTHSLPVLGAMIQQLVAYIGAANESTSMDFTLSPTLKIGAIDAHTPGQGTFYLRTIHAHPRCALSEHAH
jgi:hypothetical protein